MRIDLELIEKLRKMALHGATAIDLINVVHQELGIRTYSRGPVVIYLREAFCLQIKDLSLLAGWEGFGDGGSYSGKQINEIITPLIKENQNRWQTFKS